VNTTDTLKFLTLLMQCSHNCAFFITFSATSSLQFMSIFHYYTAMKLYFLTKMKNHNIAHHFWTHLSTMLPCWLQWCKYNWPPTTLIYLQTVLSKPSDRQ